MTALELPLVTRRIQAAAPPGLQLFLVGGAVRDWLLRRPLHDLDFVVGGDGRPVARAVADALGGAYYALDDERGVGRALVTDSGERWTLDFARMRGADLEADLAARDFCLNAMALNLDDPETILDPLGGQADLRAKVVRACGPNALSDDPARTIRAVRLATHLGFRLEVATRAATRAAGPLLANVSLERRRDEFVRCLGGPRAAAAVQALEALGLLPHLLPEATALRVQTMSPSAAGDAWDHTLATLRRLEDLFAVLHPIHNVDAASDLTLGLVSLRLGRHRAALGEHWGHPLTDERPTRWLTMLAALLHQLPGGAETALLVATRLRFSSEEARYVAATVSGVAAFSRLAADALTGAPDRRAVFQFFKAWGRAGVEAVLVGLAGYLAGFDGPAPTAPWNQQLDAASTLLRAYFETPEESVRPTPLLTGDDLMRELNLASGPKLGRVLNAVYEAQAAGEVADRGAALALARQLLAQG